MKRNQGRKRFLKSQIISIIYAKISDKKEGNLVQTLWYGTTKKFLGIRFLAFICHLSQKAKFVGGGRAQGWASTVKYLTPCLSEGIGKNNRFFYETV